MLSISHSKSSFQLFPSRTLPPRLRRYLRPSPIIAAILWFQVQLCRLRGRNMRELGGDWRMWLGDLRAGISRNTEINTVKLMALLVCFLPKPGSSSTSLWSTLKDGARTKRIADKNKKRRVKRKHLRRWIHVEVDKMTLFFTPICSKWSVSLSTRRRELWERLLIGCINNWGLGWRLIFLARLSRNAREGSNLKKKDVLLGNLYFSPETVRKYQKASTFRNR